MDHIFGELRCQRGRQGKAQTRLASVTSPGERADLKTWELKNSKQPTPWILFSKALPIALKKELSPLPAQETKSTALQNP